MVQIGEFAQKIIHVREILNEIEVKGVKNAKLIDNAYEMCNSVLQDIRDAVENYENETKETADEVGEENAE